VVAKVGDRSIALPEYQNVFQRELAQRRQVLGASFDPADPAIKKEAMDRLVNTELLAQMTAKQGFRVSDARVSQQILAMREFQTAGKFDSATYERLLRMAGLGRTQFEENLRQDLTTQQFIGGVSQSEIVTSRDVDTALRLAEQQRKFSYLVLPAANYLGRTPVTGEQIQRYYQDNLSRFEVPEQVVAQYLELSKEGLKKNIPVDAAEVHRMYEERAASFTVGEERRAHHILIEVDHEANAATVEKARQRAQDLLDRINHGESFEDLARQYSGDKGSAANGGDLGFFSRGMMVGPFEEAAFSMKRGEIRGPIRTPFGFHIIRLDQIRAGSTRSFEEVRAQLENEYRQGKADEQFYDLSERLADRVFEHSESLAPAAEELGLTVREIGPFNRDQGEGIANEAAFRQAAFSQDVLDGGHNSAPIELGSDRLVVVRIKDRQPATHLALEAVKDSIIQELRDQAAAEMARKDGEAIVERAKGGKPLEDEARANRALWNPPALVRRDNAKVPPAVLSTAFSMGRPQGDKPLVKGLPLFSGDYAVIALQEVVDGNPANAAADRRRHQADEMVQQVRQRSLDELLQSLKARATVRVFEDKLQ
jgi:peptidyl-prolyl cis-trans isomerase D